MHFIRPFAWLSLSLVGLCSWMPANAEPAARFPVVRHVMEGAGACTAALVRIDGRVFDISAAHCFEATRIEVRFGVTSSRRGRETAGRGRFSISRDDVTRMPFFDLAMFEIPRGTRLDPATSVYAIAPSVPRAGGSLTLHGYGGGIGPQSIACRVVGPALVSNTSVTHAVGMVFTEGMLITCDSPLDGDESGGVSESDVVGFSGGPILNAEGEIVGIVSATSRAPDSQGPMEILMTSLAGRRLLEIDGLTMLTPLARAFTAGAPASEAFRRTIRRRLEIEPASLTAAICYDDRGLPIALATRTERGIQLTLLRSETRAAGRRMIEVSSEALAVGLSGERERRIESEWRRRCPEISF